MNSSLECVICTSLLLILASGVIGRITNPPQNAVAEVGGQAIFNCTSELSPPTWIFSMTREDAENPSAQIIVANGCVVQPGFATHYEIDRPGGNNNMCNLIVKGTTMQQAGVYTCAESLSGMSAIFTVIDRDDRITVNNQPETVEGDTVSMSYTVNYNTSTASSKTPTIQPLLIWIDSDGHTLTASNYTETANSVTSRISVTAGRQDIRPYTCRISYEIKWPSPPTGLSFASSTPKSLSNPPNTSIINVFYNVSDANITKDNGDSCGTVVWTCNSSGNPPPTYAWFYLNNTVASYNKTIKLSLAEVNQSYICQVNNTIRNVTRTETANSTALISDYSPGCTTKPAGITDDQRRTILLAAILGGYGLLNIIAMIVFLIYYNRKSNKSKLNGRFPWLQNMLPCMNETRGNVGCQFISVILFIVMSLLVGIIVFPILVVIANCSRRSSVSMGNSDIGMRNVANVNEISPKSKAEGNPSTAAHGDVDAHYDVIRNTVKHTADDYNDATSNGAKKLVPYTIVQTNGNTADDVDRYYVSLPDTIEKKS